MSFQRAAVLAAMLSAALACHTADAQVPPTFKELARREAGGAALPPNGLEPANGARTQLSNLRITRAGDGRWLASVDYVYAGDPRNGAIVFVQSIQQHAGGVLRREVEAARDPMKPGAHTYTAELRNPNGGENDAYGTDQIIARIVELRADGSVADIYQSVSVLQAIDWPDGFTNRVKLQVAAGKQQVVIDDAVRMIDTDQRDQLKQARLLLQALVELSPRTDAAYVELARVAMKLNWGPVGLRDAESLIRTALQIRPDSVDAKILLGYVYANQHRFAQAQTLFEDAARSNPRNLWLWTNWGELYAAQGRTDDAIAKFREAVARPPTRNTYDKARQQAYLQLLPLLHAKGDLEGQEALYKQRYGEYPGAACYAVTYARFLVLQRADAGRALAVVQESRLPSCDRATSRQIQGLAQYVTWSRDSGRVELLHQARAYLPVSPALLYDLASGDAIFPVAKSLVAAGEPVDMEDNDGMNALAYALRDEDAATARRLLRLGAKPDATVGPQKMPVALIPVLANHREGIQLMQRSGVDYSRLRFQGTTALDYARSTGDDKLLRLLDPKAGKL